MVFTFNMYNSIVAFNKLQEIRLTDTQLGPTVNIYNSLIKGGISYLTIPPSYNFNYDEETNIETVPLFVDVNLNSSNYHLQADSPCVDSGTSVGAPSTDLDGTTRPQGAGYDMGAYEFSQFFYVSSDGNCGTKDPCYSKIQDAINIAATGSAILVKQGTYAESLSLGSAKTLLIKGGYNEAYNQQTANTTFIKAPKATQGSLTLQMVTIKP